MILLIVLVVCVLGIWVVFTSLHEKKLSEDYDIVRLKTKLLPVFPELSRVKMMKGKASYTINKYRVFICLRDKKTDTMYDDNMLVYVILHELAHTLCKEIGHTDLFKSIFFDLLNRAELNGLYDPSLPRPDDYCK